MNKENDQRINSLSYAVYTTGVVQKDDSFRQSSVTKTDTFDSNNYKRTSN